MTVLGQAVLATPGLLQQVNIGDTIGGGMLDQAMGLCQADRQLA